jgi:hypothetical protein
MRNSYATDSEQVSLERFYRLHRPGTETAKQYSYPSPTHQSSPIRKNQSTTRIIIQHPSELDILCGKSRECSSHAGSRRFRSFIDEYQARYGEATNKQDRMKITKHIVSTLGRSSRFLRYNPELQAYEELTHLEARDKTSHALRTACKREKRAKDAREPVDTASSSRPKPMYEEEKLLNRADDIRKAESPKRPRLEKQRSLGLVCEPRHDTEPIRLSAASNVLAGEYSPYYDEFLSLLDDAVLE